MLRRGGSVRYLFVSEEIEAFEERVFDREVEEARWLRAFCFPFDLVAPSLPLSLLMVLLWLELLCLELRSSETFDDEPRSFDSSSELLLVVDDMKLTRS